MAYGVLGSDEHPAARRLSAATKAKAMDLRRRTQFGPISPIRPRPDLLAPPGNIAGNRPFKPRTRIRTDQVSNHLLELTGARVKSKARVRGCSDTSHGEMREMGKAGRVSILHVPFDSLLMFLLCSNLQQPLLNAVGERSGWQRQPPSSMRTSMLSMPR